MLTPIVSDNWSNISMMMALCPLGRIHPDWSKTKLIGTLILENYELVCFAASGLRIGVKIHLYQVLVSRVEHTALNVANSISTFFSSITFTVGYKFSHSTELLIKWIEREESVWSTFLFYKWNSLKNLPHSLAETKLTDHFRNLQ